ncbi:hypothetical protein SAMN02910292_02538 [Lachnospiraceae bacterium XBB2008]|nr:hypothetical protein SAMN02910292_02538 [Lachnospiraceae bacterium XBB2008]
MEINSLYFISNEHSENFNNALKTFHRTPAPGDEYTATLYLLTAVGCGKPGFLESVIESSGGFGPNSFLLKGDIFEKFSFSSGEAKLIRLAYHIFSLTTPTLCKDTTERDEFERYLPVNILSGLSPDFFSVALEGLVLMCAPCTGDFPVCRIYEENDLW